MSDDARGETQEIGEAIAAAAATVGAPDALRARIAAAEPRRRQTPALSAAGPGQRRRAPALLAATVAGLALTIAVVLLAVPSKSDDPTVTAAAALALRPPTAPPPAVDQRDERFVSASVGTVRFPNYGYDSGWRVAGGRRDELGGRDAVTVVYRGWGHRIGYTVVDGAPLARPQARVVRRDGRRYAVLRRHGALVVTWRQGGHTCILASRSAPLRELLGMATWS